MYACASGIIFGSFFVHISWLSLAGGGGQCTCARDGELLTSNPKLMCTGTKIEMERLQEDYSDSDITDGGKACCCCASDCHCWTDLPSLEDSHKESDSTVVHVDQHQLKRKELGVPSKKTPKKGSSPKKDTTPKKGSPSSLSDGTPKKKSTQKKAAASKSPSKSLLGTKRKRDTPEKPSRTESGECKHVNLLC